ncbi:insect pheromone-binding family, a10/OS-D domain-containing protein [Phthorimaea operculella]|nr:insect pheromone-binding family, a10/OS-D domain-containing protein [Phthorimaea operculella]
MIAMRLLVVVACVVAAVVAEEKYTDKYDNIDIKEILENKRLLQAYVDCMLEKGKCTPEGKELKDHLQDALATGCEKCTENQKKGAQTVIEHLIKNEPESWKALCEKYDPEGTFRKKYEGLAKEHGIEIPE